MTKDISTDIVNCLLQQYLPKFNQSFERIYNGVENYNYLVNKNKYVLRIYKSKGLSDIEREVKLLLYLNYKEVKNPEIIKNIQESAISFCEGYYAALFEYVEGTHPPLKHLATKLAENIGINISYMHKVLLDFDANGFPQNFADSFDLGSMSNEYFKYISAVLDELYKYDLRNLRKSVIHGDICRENLIIKDNQLKAILDFDDAHTNYLIWDVATAISQLFITKTSKIDWAGIRNFFKGYNLWMTLNFTEAKVIITLLKLVNLRLAILADSHLITKESSEWKSIKSSVLTKLKLIEKNEKKLTELILEVSR